MLVSSDISFLQSSFNVRLQDRSYRQIYVGSGRKSVPHHQHAEIPCWAALAPQVELGVLEHFFLHPRGLKTQALSCCRGGRAMTSAGEIIGMVQQQLAGRKKRADKKR